ncbi:DUF1801 domain-containing protein [Shimia ponticola]|uniref:DUF1801 domain-containing protein n=1 Tax=Shimia ponticola TaxID=2582893 RepID=UPI0011BFAB77|nr:DUF1801 domain-containing protein [Shimia ponticola]
MRDPSIDAIRSALLELVAETLPDASLREMYGGMVIELEQGNPKSRIGGVFAYEAHVSLEFTYGAQLPDANGVLQGGGKARRHIKLTALDDIRAKDCAGFLQSAAAL